MAEKIFGIVYETPQPGKAGYQQRIILEGDDLKNFLEQDKSLRKLGKLKFSSNTVWGREGSDQMVYGVSSLDAALPGSGKEVGDRVEVALTDSNGYARVLVMVNDDLKKQVAAKKLADLREQAIATADLKGKAKMFKSAGFDPDMVQLLLLQQATGATFDVGSAHKALQAAKTTAPVTRSSRLAAANGETEETEKVHSLNDPDALTGNEA